MSATKRCSRCREVKSLAEFTTNRSARDGRQAYCPPCQAINAREYRARPGQRERILAKQREHYRANRDRLMADQRRYKEENPNRVAQTARKHLLKRLYGLTPLRFATMRDDQDGRCLICRRETTRLHIDHDHATGAVRGLLCSDCNTGLGLFRDDPLSLTRAISYLASSSQRHYSDAEPNEMSA